jgi:hypothetical protein
VRLVRGPWNKPYIDELCVFPLGIRKDQADGSSGAFNKLALKKPQPQGFAPSVVGGHWGLGGGRTAVAGMPGRFV